MKLWHVIAATLGLAAIVYGTTSHINAGILPNHTLTPGAINTSITQANIKDNICNPNWSTKSERPASNYTTALKVKQLASGYAIGSTWNGKISTGGDQNTADYEEDHLISLELGGNPTSEQNLWPEKYPTAKQKDQVENYLHSEVCAGTITLAEAQKEISTDWTKVKMGKFGSVDNVTDADDEVVQ